ncbi:MAG: potassium-transporting ATPase subunit KdpA, partial [Janthinobacterium lividum]
AIKLLGTNGGGFFNTNSAHPFENPTALTNLVECWSEILVPFALAVTFGTIVKDRRQGFALFWTMAILMVTAVVLCYAAEAGGNPLLTALGIDPSMGNMEGKEVRFGTAMSSLFAVTTTATSTGAVNAMHDSFTPLGGMVPMFLIQLGEIVPGGVGSGLYGILVFALLAVFVAGLMVGRTPEYLGKKVQAREIKLAMLAVLILPMCILSGTAISLVTASGLGSLANAGPHGLSEMLYAWSSATGNNGSAFAGLSADTPLLDYGLGAAMLLGRFAFLIPVLAIAGSIAAKPKLAPSAGTFPTHGPLFVGLLTGVILILGGLQFLPALSLGPLAEHFAMQAGQTF